MIDNPNSKYAGNPPLWKLAPLWANYLTMDNDGDCFFWEVPPCAQITLGEWIAPIFPAGGRVCYAGHLDPVVYDPWHSCCERRNFAVHALFGKEQIP